MVESRCGAAALGRTYLLPPLSSGGASVVRPWLRFHTPLIEPDMQVSRIRLSDKTSRLHPRHVAPKRAQAYEPEVPVKVREWIGPALASPDVVLDAQPPTQPRRCVVVDRPVRLVDGAYLEVVRPSAQHAVQRAHQLRGVLPSPRSGGQRVDCFDHALDALLRRPVSQACLAGSRRVHSPERVPQEVELPFRDPTDSCLLFVDRELQPAHELAQSLQGLFGLAPPAQDHEVVGVGHDARAEALLQPELLGSEWHFLDAGDFNNDGTSDLLWQRESDHMLLMQQVNGNQIGASSFLGQLGPEW